MVGVPSEAEGNTVSGRSSKPSRSGKEGPSGDYYYYYYCYYHYFETGFVCVAVFYVAVLELIL